MKAFRNTLLVILSIFLLLIAGGVLALTLSAVSTNQQQAAIEPFYTPPNPLPSVPAGTLLRSEPVTEVTVPNASIYRVLYTTELADGRPTVSGGLVFVPTADPPNTDGTRPVVAWAHPTTGQGNSCAPSRNRILFDTDGWLDQMMARGWLVTATDYAGVGTSGQSNYLIGQSETNDLVNSVRAARHIPNAHPGKDWVAWGHSQGGHSTLWAGHLGQETAPELNLLAVAAAAPAGELPEIVEAQWDTMVGWVIAPEITQSWPNSYPNLDLVIPMTLSPQALRTYDGLADACFQEAGVVGIGRELFDQNFFTSNPNDNPIWSAAIKDQTPPPMPATMPVLIAQGTADEVVFPEPQALLQQKWCAAGSDLTMLWLGDVNHMKAPRVSGPMVVDWFADRFAHQPTHSTSCEMPPPVASSIPVQ